MLPDILIDRWLNRPARALAQSLARRRFLKRLGTLLLGSAALPFSAVGRLAGAAGTLPDTTALQDKLAGSVLRRGDDSYEIWRLSMMWQPLKADRYPDILVRAANEADVVEAVNFARSHQMKITVRGGGHSWCHSSVRDGGMLLDVSSLRDVAIDADARLAAVQPAVNGRELAAKLEPHGLAFPVPHCGMVPMSGYLLGGGLGWNGESWEGMACFSIKAAEIVTPDGALITADDKQNTDWFWAVRGAGPGFFGVVTKYHLQLYPLPRAITTSTYMWPLEYLEEVVEWWSRTAETLAVKVEMIFLLASAPDAVFAQCQGESQGKVCILSATAFADTPEEARAILAPLANGPIVEACVLRDEYQPSPYQTLFDWDDASFPRQRMIADTLWSNAKPIDILSAIQGHFKTVPSPASTVICQLRPQPRIFPDAAYSMRAPTYIAGYSNWKGAEHDAVNTQWLRDAMTLMEPFAVGHYVNESDLAANPTRSVRSYAEANWQRLQRLRERYDPHGVFHTYIGLE